MGPVSVIIPTYNRTKFLEEAINSILEQTHPVGEIIIVNDGSDAVFSDGLHSLMSLNEVITRIDIPATKGASYARNIGISASSGDYVMFLDDDDTLDKQFVQKACEMLESDNNIDAVISWTEVLPCKKADRHERLTKNLLRSRKLSYSELSENSLSYFLIHCPMVHSFMFKREVFKEHQFPEDLTYGEDQFLWLQMCSRGVRFKKLDATGSYVRLHTENVTKKRDFDDRSKFYKKLESSGIVAGEEEYNIHSVRTFYFMLVYGRMPSSRLIGSAFRNIELLLKFSWLHFKVRFQSIL